MRTTRLLAVLLCTLVGCSQESGLRRFSSDGCSLFPDRSLISTEDWCSCCLEHDLAYWRGGTRAQREAADLALRQCVVATTGNELLVEVMYDGVRLGGSPYFYNWYRWGYGWPYDRKYQALTAAENQLADGLLAQYGAQSLDKTCAH